MKIGKTIKERGSSLSFEFFPPREEAGEAALFDAVSKLKAMNPTFVSVTYGAGGSTSKNTEKIVTRIIRDFDITAMPHLTLINQAKAEIKKILDEYKKLGIENVLALRGDPPQGSTMTGPQNPDFRYAKDLVKMAVLLEYSVAVAVYPEGHQESPGLDMDIEYTKQKVVAGAEFAITQLFFDNRVYYNFLEKARKAGINIPVIPGILPITDLNKIQQFAQRCGASVPSEIVEKFSQARTPGEMRKIGLEITINQCADLLRNGVTCFHFYSLNRAEAVTEIIDGAGLRKLALPLSESEDDKVGECLTGRH